MAIQRKLFLTHAGELAHRLVRAAGRARPGEQSVITQFARSYAERHHRPGLFADVTHLREVESTIGREAMFVMAVEVQRLLPDAFASRPRQGLRPDETALAEAFFGEFIASLHRALDWSPAEAAAERQAFDRDFEMYQRWGLRPGGSVDSLAGNASPFADRCALLLDPSMMEQARRAGSAFEVELAQMAARTLGRLGRSRPRGRRLSPHPKKKKPKTKARTSKSHGSRPSARKTARVKRRRPVLKPRRRR